MLKPAFIFTDHAILQCKIPVYVWGESDAETVTVTFGGNTATAPVQNGRFLCELPPMQPNIRSELTFESENEKLTLTDVVTGEVWLAGGQSNMEHPTFCTEFDENDLVDDADIRLFTVPRLTFYKGDTYGYHFECLHSVDTPWTRCTVEDALHFTAIGYFFAHKLRKHLNMPVGIISCNWGATPVESWTRKEYLLSDPLARRAWDKKQSEIEEAGGLDKLIAQYTEYQSKLKEFCLCYDAPAITRDMGVAWYLRHAGEGQPPLPMEVSFYRFPTSLRNNMLERIVPYSVRGVIWHQGESNTSAEIDSKEHYMALYRSMMADWRDAFKNPEMPFYLVQIAGVAWHGDGADYWSGVRDAQEELSKQEKNVYLTVSYDLSEPDNIHPAKKQPMGERLAAAALANTYSLPMAWKCPEAISASMDGHIIMIKCSYATAWHTFDGNEIEGFYIVNRDGIRIKTTASACGSDISLIIPDGEVAQAVEYSRLNYSYTNLLNEHNLPLTPFKMILRQGKTAMQTLFFKDYRKTGNDAYDLYRLISDLGTKKDIKIIFDKDTYKIDPNYCFEKCVNISNHGWNGYKRFFALLDGMENVELDFGGSIIDIDGAATPFGILNSKNITVKNAILENKKTQFMQVRVVGHGDGYVDLEKMLGASQFQLRHNLELVTNYYQCFFVIKSSLEFNCDMGEIEKGTGDHSFDEFLWNMRFEDIGDNKLRLHGIKRYPPIGNIVVFSAARRLGCGFFCEDSSDITLENITVHSCYGMGVLAQTCHNIHLNCFNTLRHGDQYYTANADATHFVNCTGLVTVENSTFEGQLDDALNIHGIYTRIESKLEHEIIVREVHIEAKGIRIYRDGDRIQIVNSLSLVPYTEKTVEKVEYINQDLIRLILREGTDDIKIGDDVESLDRAADLIFRNNIVRNNRARGMLIATRGKTIIENCYFHSSGSAILFESNGDYWFESGGVQDVTIRNNTFDRCKYSKWGGAVISCIPRKAVEEGKYFNKSIKVKDNSFILYQDVVVQFDNTAHVEFTGNTITADCASIEPKLTLNHIGDATIETNINIERLDENA